MTTRNMAASVRARLLNKAKKDDIRILDFVDTGHPALLRMWDTRQRGYKAIGCRKDPKQETIHSPL